MFESINAQNQNQTQTQPSMTNRFSLSLTPTAPITSQTNLIEPINCVPLWGITARGVYQALCVQTLAISITSASSQTDNTNKSIAHNLRTRTFHFHIRKCDNNDGEKRDRDREEELHTWTPDSLSLDFRDFARALAM